MFFLNFPSPIRSYAFVLTDFSECSRTCGGGRQSRDCLCYLHIDGEPDERVAFEFCLHFAENQTIPGPLTRECETFSCPEWRVGDFGEVIQLFQTYYYIYK